MAGRLRVLTAALLGGSVVFVASAASAQATSADLGFTSANGSATSSLVTVTMDVINSGPSAAVAPVITLALPAGLTLARGSVGTVDTCAFEPTTRTVTCAWPSPALDPGVQSSAVVVLSNTGLPAGSPVSIEAQISSTTPDPNASNNVVAVTVTVPGGPVPTVPGGASAELALTEVQPAPQARPGTAVLAWDVTNLGVTPAQDVVVTFTFPAGPTFGGGNVATSPCTAGPVTGPTSCPFARPLNPSEALVATLVLDTAAVPAGTRLSVQASVASSTPDPNPANNVSTITFLVPGQGPATTAPPGLVATGGGPISPILAVALVMVGIGMVVAAREGRRRHRPSAPGG